MIKWCDSLTSDTDHWWLLHVKVSWAGRCHLFCVSWWRSYNKTSFSSRVCFLEEEDPQTRWLWRPMTNRGTWIITYGPPVCHTHHFLLVSPSLSCCLSLGPRGPQAAWSSSLIRMACCHTISPSCSAQMKWNVRKWPSTHFKLSVLTQALSPLIKDTILTCTEQVNSHHWVWTRLLVKNSCDFFLVEHLN